MENPILFEFYHRLISDRDWTNSGLDGYYLLGKLLQQPQFKPRDFNDLAFALETIWVKSERERARFRQLLGQQRLELIEALDAWNSRPQEPLPAVQPSPGSQDDPTKDPGGVGITAPLAPPTTPPTPAAEGPKTAAADPGIPTDQPERGLDTAGAPGFTISYDNKGTGEYFVVQRQPGRQSSSIRRPYLFTNDYFPIRDRNLQQAWRSLKSTKQAGEDTIAISIPRTIRHTAQQGFFSGFRFKKQSANQLKVFILIDESESMIAVEAFGKELCRAAADSGAYAGLRPLYFNKVPAPGPRGNDYILSREGLMPNVTLSQLFMPHPKKDILVLIYSDAGALSGQDDEQRTKLTREFIRNLYQRTGFAAWLNPAPKYRWPDSNAGRFLEDIPMFEATGTGFQNAIATLKGKIIHQTVQ